MRLNSPTAKYAGVIEVFDNVIPNTEQLIRYLDAYGDWVPAKIGHESNTDPETRDNVVTFIPYASLRCPDLLRDFVRNVWRYLLDYAERYQVPFSDLEHVNINRYEAGQRYKPHADDGPMHNRVISALLYLNDVQSGGETEFVYHDVSVTPRAGRLIIFPSNYAYTHAAHPPQSGRKYSAAFWTVK